MTTKHKKILNWFLFFNVLGILTALLVNSHRKESFLFILFECLLSSNLIGWSGVSGLSFFEGSIGAFLADRYQPFIGGLFLCLVVFPAVLISGWVQSYILKDPNYPSTLDFIKNFYLPSALLSFCTGYFYLRKETNRDIEIKSLVPEPSGEVFPKTGLVIRQEGRLFIIPYKEIIYLSASGNKSIVHTEVKDFELHRTMKEVYQDLPENLFFRVHRKFIIQLEKLLSLEYFIAGSYMAYLNDIDETEIPVGRTFAIKLKNRIGVSKVKEGKRER